jgi:hypothetical protein
VFCVVTRATSAAKGADVFAEDADAAGTSTTNVGGLGIVLGVAAELSACSAFFASESSPDFINPQPVAIPRRMKTESPRVNGVLDECFMG